MKRFTDTKKWEKAWFQNLPPHLKCFWNLLCDASDAAGVWDTNFKLASALIGKPVTAKDMAAFGDRVALLPCGKYALVSFIEFQYGKLSTDCKAHTPIFRALEKHRLSNGYPKAIHSLQEKDKEEEEEKDKEKERPNPSSPAGDHARFIDLWTQAYSEHHGGARYVFQGGKDGAAVRELLQSSNESPETLMAVAVAAWKNPSGFNSKMAASISGFKGRFNDIRQEVLKAKPKTHAIAPSAGPKGWNPMTQPMPT